jgi:hypothetical protein
MSQAFIRLFSRPSDTSTPYVRAVARIHSVRRQILTWDLLVMMFHDLDRVLFHGYLYHRVCFKWIDMRIPNLPGELIYVDNPQNWSK